MRVTFDGFPSLFSGLILATIAVSACSDPPVIVILEPEDLTALCESITEDIVKAGAQDAIPALTDPVMVVPPGRDNQLDYLKPTDRVVGLEAAGEYLALPHNVFWWHEIMNLNDFGLAATYCPLTGSSIVFLRSQTDGAELGVSGLLFKNNLVMYDRASGGVRTLWPQMLGAARCGPQEGRTLTKYPSVEMEWADWLALHPDTKVVSGNQGYVRDYTNYPYGDYEVEDNDLTLFPIESLDPRRLPKERVLGIPFGDEGGRAFPFGSLNSLGALAVVDETMGVAGSEEPIVVFWDRDANAAVMFRPQTGGQNLTFEVTNGAFMDVETGSQWTIDGEAVSGPLTGSRLSIIPESYVAFWFAFSAFFPNLDLWAP